MIAYGLSLFVSDPKSADDEIPFCSDLNWEAPIEESETTTQNSFNGTENLLDSTEIDLESIFVKKVKKKWKETILKND